ncbi:hypothetical protein BHYOB78_00860 [Brachyspira hyodysenteriae ATCC 27164]|uniref:Methyltransferase n=1 Tax=Brachyspira hyodysenteriae ATCC 27164 TaxID=1266923 RepID=A0A3B6VV71_BRAHO|nr:hypothetical protein BHYOB78_00860 [Brachyspira hyodysenteriae ATCC 27164]TVL61445.1 hypothetical protein A9X85_13460 [Brachyspira hyodysenteriae]
MDEIVWWIPFKKLRNNIRIYLNYLIDKDNKIKITEENTEIIYNLKKEATLETIHYIKKYALNAILFDNIVNMYEHIFYNYLFQYKNTNYLFLEFGVFNGTSINRLSSIMEKNKFYGFDSFEGLPNNWEGWTFNKGYFDLSGNMPKVNDNVCLVKGYFDKTLPDFLKEHQEKIIFIHIDCDLYSSTKIIFDNIYDRIIVGTIIIFDEYFNYPNWQNHEYKAFKEFCEKYNITYEYIAISNHQQVGVIIKSI